MALDSWHKVKIKTTDATAAPAIGLVPASYLAPSVPLRAVTALYDYTPALGEDGQLENDEEMEIAEGEQLELLEEEEDWILVQRANSGGAGFVPATYVEVSLQPHAQSHGTDLCSPYRTETLLLLLPSRRRTR